jgi:general secretion pathway protein C
MTSPIRLHCTRFYLALALSFTITLSALLTTFVIHARHIASLTPARVSNQRVGKLEPFPIANHFASFQPSITTDVATKDSLVWQSQKRAPFCEDLTAKIVSQNERPELSLATLSHKGEPPSLVRLGSRLGKNQVVGIGYDRGRLSPSVFLASERGLCQAMLFEKPEKSASPNPSIPRRKSDVRVAQSTEIRIERSAVDRIFERAYELTQGVRIVPDVKDGVARGMRVFGVHPDSLLAALGIKNGDRIERVNGMSISTPEGALSAYTNMRYAQQFNVEIERAGRPAHIEIRVN